MESMKLKQIHSKLFIAFHGAPDQDIVSFALQCISGQGAFESLWEKEEDAAGVNTLTLTTAVSRRDDSRYISNKNLTCEFSLSYHPKEWSPYGWMRNIQHGLQGSEALQKSIIFHETVYR